ncbi:MAG: 23S rRNA (pseudouridine(1915)-N(3))-methyltransferase RlmH [Alphaproteobacteria bacterium]|jgi:23S rRNA (pseudouridine1915-N3)-methyltransferase|nr:23S rRNA (pseudouridine(1915)-N(3))-methyltransferase RlmH [Alphaproteobacteria bacterium]
MIINIISVGKLSPGYRGLADHYCKMIKWKLKETELNYTKKLSEIQVKAYEAKLINNQIISNSYKIVLDVQGQQLNSQEFSYLFKNQMMIGQNIDIIIGGAFGLDNSIIKNSNIRLSLSKMTLPHQLAKLVLLEQIYRSQTILSAHPYHK